jgi:hypothetical protein
LTVVTKNAQTDPMKSARLRSLHLSKRDARAVPDRGPQTYDTELGELRHCLKEWTLLDDPLGLVIVDPDHSDEEPRYLLVGTSAHRRRLVGAFTERSPRLRLISARLATRRERRR